jgi:hypothetical protein
MLGRCGPTKGGRRKRATRYRSDRRAGPAADRTADRVQAPQRAVLPGDLIEVVRQSPDHMHEPKVGKICSKA